MNFLVVAQAFDAIKKESSRTAITKILATLFTQATPEESRVLCYMCLGLLRAPYYTTQFNIAEKNLEKIIAELLNTEVSTIHHAARVHGDLAHVIQDSEWPEIEKKLSIEEVYQKLVTLEAISGTGSQEQKSLLLKSLLHQVDALSASYIIRIVLGKLRLGFSDMTLLDALSWTVAGDKSLHDQLEHGYNICADLGLIAYTLKKDGVQAVEQLPITVGIPIRPAAAERLATAQELFHKLGPCIAQPKLDGFRLQLHVDLTNPEPFVAFYSRNLLDMSAMFPEIKQACLSLGVKTLICEGEAIAYDQHAGAFVPFQETVKRRRKHAVDQMATDMPLQVFIFDILYLDGQSLLACSHSERRVLLESVFATAATGTLLPIAEREISNPEQLEHYFHEVIEQGLEGLVVKKPQSCYQPGKRNFNWIKLKRTAEGHLSDSIDAVILGYYAGMGKRATFGIGAFLVGVYNKELDCYQTIAKVGTGLTDAEWYEIKRRCDAIKTHEQPKNTMCAPELRPDVWVEPHLVCVIFADEITVSPLHYAGKTDTSLGLALRFPRFMGYRPDKGPEEATSVEEVRRLFGLQYSQSKKIASS